MKTTSNNIKINIKNPRIVYLKDIDRRGAIEMALHGCYAFNDCDLQTKKEVVKELTLSYNREELKEVIKNIFVLGQEYGDHLSPEERYLALRDVCDWFDLRNTDESAMKFIADEMKKIVTNKLWWWESGRTSRSLLPKTEVFEKKRKRGVRRKRRLKQEEAL